MKGMKTRYIVAKKERGAVVFGLRKNREHIYGEECSGVTDHTALVWLIYLRDLKQRLARWVRKVQASHGGERERGRVLVGSAVCSES